MTARELGVRLNRKEISAVEVTSAFLNRIQQLDDKLKAFVTVIGNEALSQAKAVDDRRSNGETLGLLAGVPIAVKDNMCTRGVPTTCSSRILEQFIPPYDATVVSRLRDQNMVILGKTNLDEFAMGSSTENSAFFTTRNPWDMDRVPGGSSGGSAAAVAAGLAPLALGSDTGGSIRQPAALCGVAGLKPTYGLVSRYGLVAFASSLDQIGPFAIDVLDTALVLDAIAGHDPMDATSSEQSYNPVFPQLQAQGEIKGIRIGIPKEFYAQGVEAEVSDLVRRGIEALCSVGAEAEDCSLPTAEYGLATYYIIAPAEASSNLARYDGVKFGLRSKAANGHIGMTEKTREEGFGAEVKQRIMIGSYALSAGYYDAYYKRAQQVRSLFCRDFDRLFQKYDVLITPTTPSPAFRIGEKADDPLQMKLSDVCTLPCNMAGLPGLSIPCGFIDGLPVGMQILGKRFDELTVLRVARAYELATGLAAKRPLLDGGR